MKYDQFNRNEYEAHRLQLELIKPGSKVLDIGCATGYFARELLKRDCETWGVDNDKIAIKKARRYCKKVFISDINNCTSLPFPKHYFDYVTLLDVIEHLAHPETILSTIKGYLKPRGVIIVSTPNIAHASIRWMLLKGDFEYSSVGIMDSTHVHFFTLKSLKDFLKKQGYKIIEVIPTNGMCKVPLLYKITDRLPKMWQYAIAKKIPTLFSFQFIAVAKPVGRKAGLSAK